MPPNAGTGCHRVAVLSIRGHLSGGVYRAMAADKCPTRLGDTQSTGLRQNMATRDLAEKVDSCGFGRIAGPFWNSSRCRRGLKFPR